MQWRGSGLGSGLCLGPLCAGGLPSGVLTPVASLRRLEAEPRVQTELHLFDQISSRAVLVGGGVGGGNQVKSDLKSWMKTCKHGADRAAKMKPRPNTEDRRGRLIDEGPGTQVGSIKGGTDREARLMKHRATKKRRPECRNWKSNPDTQEKMRLCFLTLEQIYLVVYLDLIEFSLSFCTALFYSRSSE